jgi:chromosome segregation ATPase
VEEMRTALEQAERAAGDARAARDQVERDLRELSESGDDVETALARQKAELAELRRELEDAAEREEIARARIEELEQGLQEVDEDAQIQQVHGEADRLRASLGQMTEKWEREAERRGQLEEELQSRVVAEERLRAMLQAKVASARSGEDVPDADEITIPASVRDVVATSQGDFLERLAAAKREAEAVER